MVTDTILTAVVTGVFGGGLLYIGKLSERFWSKKDRKEEGNSVVEVRHIESEDNRFKSYQEQIADLHKLLDSKDVAWQKRWDEYQIRAEEREKSWQKRLDDQQARFEEKLAKQHDESEQRDDRQQKELDEWKSKFFVQQQSVVQLQGELLALRTEYTILKREYDSIVAAQKRRTGDQD